MPKRIPTFCPYTTAPAHDYDVLKVVNHRANLQNPGGLQALVAMPGGPQGWVWLDTKPRLLGSLVVTAIALERDGPVVNPTERPLDPFAKPAWVNLDCMTNHPVLVAAFARFSLRDTLSILGGAIPDTVAGIPLLRDTPPGPVDLMPWREARRWLVEFWTAAIPAFAAHYPWREAHPGFDDLDPQEIAGLLTTVDDGW